MRRAVQSMSQAVSVAGSVKTSNYVTAGHLLDQTVCRARVWAAEILENMSISAS